MRSLLGKLGLIGFLFLFISCNGGSVDDPDIPDEPEVIIPSNVSLNIAVVGTDANNPNGDGSGLIQCSATATDAVKYGYRFGTGSEIESITGDIEYTYTEKETNNYTVYVVAYSSTGHMVTVSKEITVYVTAELALVWSDEFDTNGAPLTSKWNYDMGNGQSGWGNNELEYYTDRSENVIQENGNLVITAIKESYQGYDYTSARLKTQGKFSFTYGKVEVRAKLPAGTGVWPAIWMLGDDITTIGWPACGEIDIMEYVGYEPNEVNSAIHTPSSSGNTVNHASYDLVTAEEEFHLYGIEWTSTEIKFFVDDTLHYTYKPTAYNDETWPFTKNQFLILNLAIGGNWGGAQGVDDTIFPQQFMIDYVRVYQ
jgi:beta-glucanase (GH16 family)